MTLIEMLVFVVIISAGHFVGEIFEAKMGLSGWFGGCFLGIAFSVGIFAFVARLGKWLGKKERGHGPPACPTETEVLDVDLLLASWAEALKRAPIDVPNLIRETKTVLSFLCVPENNTRENCRKVDTFVSLLTAGADLSSINDDMKAIIIDMGLNLRYTHDKPEVADSLQSTPCQLLKRLESLDQA